MANEAAIRLKMSDAIDFTIADGTAIAKGSVLKMTDPRTAIITSADDDIIAGIATREKITTDGRTQLSVCRYGIYDMLASGSITIGDAVSSAGATTANAVYKAPVTAKGASIIGYALETATDAETFQVMVNIGSGGNQIS